MKRLLYKWDKLRLTHKLHQLQKRYKRARLNGYVDKMEDYMRKINEVQEKLSHIK